MSWRRSQRKQMEAVKGTLQELKRGLLSDADGYIYTYVLFVYIVASIDWPLKSRQPCLTGHSVHACV